MSSNISLHVSEPHPSSTALQSHCTVTVKEQLHFCHVRRLNDLPPKSALIMITSKKDISSHKTKTNLMNSAWMWLWWSIQGTALTKPQPKPKKPHQTKTQLFSHNTQELCSSSQIDTLILFHVLSSVETSLFKQMLSSDYWLTSSVFTLW